MARNKLIDRMRESPRDWAISDIEAVCDQHGIRITPPQRGSHYKLRNPATGGILTIPAHRPVKPVYIRKLLDLIDQTNASSGRQA